jgi:hypothetical protein
MLSLLGLLMAFVSALMLYLASPHSRRRTFLRPTPLRALAGLAALVSLLCGTAALGAGAGFCAMLAAWMFALMLWPSLALLLPANAATAEND